MLTVAFLGSAVRSHGGSLSENSVRCCRVEIRFNLAGMTGIHLSPTAIARLKACSVQAAHKQLLAGRFGPFLRRGRNCYAALTAFERHTGRHFTAEQIEAAVDGHPDRLITITPED
jgi:hypothetical protein